jgi:putative tricarboxylic transport membrane protein
MRPWRQLASALFAALGVFMIVEGVDLKLQSEFGPGPGFMAFIVGAILAAVSVVWGVRTSFAAAAPMPEGLLPDAEGLKKVGAIIGALVLLATLFTVVGFKLSMFGFLLAAQFIFGRDQPLAKIIVAALCSFGLFALFERVLRVPLPTTSIDALAAWGF